MSVKGEMYKTPAAKKKHEAMESPAMRMKEYGTKATPKPQQPGKATPTAKPKVTDAIIKKGEAEFIKELESGKTFAEARKAIIKKYGFWPNGRTN